MDITTKYKINDRLYFLNDNVVVDRKINEIVIKVDLYHGKESINNDIKINIMYGYTKYVQSAMGFNPILYVSEENAFHTKEELLNSL